MGESKLENLTNPGALMRPAPFWSWNDKLDEAELRRQIREMAEKGWGSYFMHSRVGLVTGYLTDEWLKLIEACADEASKTGTYAWLYDEDKWPSGFAGGIVPESDEAYRSRGLVLVKKGEATQDDTVLTAVSYGGTEYEICRRVQPLGNNWFNGASYVDLMSPEAVRAFIEVTHEAYKKAVGQHFGKSIPGIFTDEPGYLFQLDYKVPVVPWSDFLPDFFKEMKGYDITGKLPQLFFDIDDYRKVRFDFYDAATELFKRSFTKQYYDWCEANGLIMTGHFMSEDSLTFQTQWSGDVMSHYEYMHWPGIDKLGRLVSPVPAHGIWPAMDQTVTVKQVTSVADQLGKERSFSEVFGCVGGQVSFFHRKWIGDWQAALGIGFINHHLSLYSMRGERKRDYPANLFYQQPWWEDERGFADYQGRVCAAASEGKRLVEILLIQPMGSVWAEYSPLHADSAFAAEATYDTPFAVISRKLMESNLDYHYGNETLMAKYASVEGRSFKVGRHRYGCVILPPMLTIRSSTVELLRQYAEAGGNIIIVNKAPALVDGIETVIDLPGAKVAASIGDAVRMADALFPKRIQTIDRLTGVNAPDIYVHSRAVDGSIRHLIVNTDEKREVNLTVRIPDPASRDFAVLDLGDGSLHGIDAPEGAFDVTLYPAGSLLLISGEEACEAIEPAPDVLDSGACFRSRIASRPAMLLEDFECELLEDNVFLLNNFTLELDGRQVHEGPVCASWHKLFYSAPDGTPFKATYTFHSDAEIDGCFAAIEVAENLDSITFNGTEVHPKKSAGELGSLDPEKSWKDVNFTKVPLPALKQGENVLVIEGRKVNNITGPGWHIRVHDWQNHRATEAEEVYIVGRFSVSQYADGLFGIAPYKQPGGKNLAHEGFPFYSGRAALKSEFNLAEKPEGPVHLQLNGVEAASARVRVNGVDCGTLRWAPFVVDVSKAVKAGDNILEIELSTTLVNAFGPNRRAGIKTEDGIGPHSFMQMERFTNDYVLFDFGLRSVGVYL